ncbi:TLD domain-containing protein 2 isoform X3 [Selaginella moellendorffii]|uniref:TLD domain-containing protein 2 isoform X3 n=1 Tax=Selaginella moellendorffii TaxID=88036 RepID=UPI000D1C7E85|nr:TLD domain-containing protein 2 isoform X3 [Selaginella moellendorffii]|eukprot:XP_024535997.1 TLD domain-containing protein 2 isoform X3 [Selaginella moellendorffii]
MANSAAPTPPLYRHSSTPSCPPRNPPAAARMSQERPLRGRRASRATPTPTATSRARKPLPSSRQLRKNRRSSLTSFAAFCILRSRRSSKAAPGCCSTARDGISLHTLYRKSVLLPGPCLLVAGDRKGAVFGGLLLAPFKPTRNKYQGTNQTFVFTNVSGPAKVFRPTGRNRYYFLCTNDALAIGGGGHFALYLDSDLLTGSSGACETFGSECLAHAEDFDLKDVELWGFAHSSQRSSLGKTTNAFESL